MSRALLSSDGCGLGRKTLKWALSTVLSVVMVSQAWAVDPPRFDWGLRCASLVNSRSVMACEHSEDAARHVVLAKWANYPLQLRHFCVQAETLRPKRERSYVTLAKCLGEANTTS